ncbi:acyl carrier protein [Streptomyces boncukensis]|uniref:Acyl carrier protein n=1 Tax=Streptomyces boncukensis TaxID=2711219 RepID=A0A6G4WW44_9ACTN|nr:acyl carrier protein [Streptomyces boncukensis]NGO68691.1 acyl carrier protein [Streptomyces boncukensis]
MWDARFEEILRKHLPFLSAGEPLTEDLVLRDHGLDSMAMVDLLALLEQEFGATFVGDAMSMENFATPRTLWETLSRVTAGAA